MDRRGFLKGLGVGGALVVATPQLVLAATTKIATPERRVFVPPDGGWLAWSANESALAYVRRIQDTSNLYVDDWSGGYASPQWTLDIERYAVDGDPMPSFNGPAQIGGVEGWLKSWDQTFLASDACRIHEQYMGYGVAPDVRALGNVRATVTRWAMSGRRSRLSTHHCASSSRATLR